MSSSEIIAGAIVITTFIALAICISLFSPRDTRKQVCKPLKRTS